MVAHMPMVYKPDGDINEEALSTNIRRLVSEGIEAIYLLGSSGEFFNVSPDEYRRAAKLFVKESGPNVLKIVGCGSPRLGETIEMARWLNTSGVDCLLVIPPYFIPLNSEERRRSIR